MPRFHFHLYDDLVSHDEEGVQLVDTAAAVAHATAEARQVAAAQVLTGRIHLDHRIEVAAGDENGPIVATVTFGDAVKVFQAA